VDKLTLAALEATLAGPVTPAWSYLRTDAAGLRARCDALSDAVRDAVDAQVVACESAVGGGGAPRVRLPSWAIALPAGFAARLRIGTPAVVGRIEHDRCLLDLRCVPEYDDARVAEAIRRCT